MTSRIGMLLAIAVIALLGSVAAACGDDDGNGGGFGDGGGGDALTLEEYFQRLEELGNEFEEEGTALEAEFDELGADASEEEALELTADFLEQTRDLFERFVGELGDLNPPDEVAALHNDAVTAADIVLEFFNDAADQAADASSTDDLEAVFEDLFLNEDLESFDQACFDLQDVADENGIAVDLSCED